MELAKSYSPQEHEDAIYQLWELSGTFNPDNLPEGKQSFSIAMPPPNATGTLHVGHSMMLVLQDLVTRYHRMQGDTTLWLPGTDHASIATQNKVEKQLAKEGVTRQELGREAFLERVQAYVEESRATIRTQIKKMGSSCDWSRERYTLDAGLSKAVSQMFIQMYQDGLIYRGNRMVNWCPRCQSTLSDDEVKYIPEKSRFYYLKYGPVIIGTARPETKFQDKIIIVHPRDSRYKDLVGKELDIEWIEGTLRAQVIADSAADMEFGTGAMTITPAHSFEDFDLAQKYKIPVIKIIDEQGNLTAAAGSFVGKNARASRDEIIALLASKGLVDHIDEEYEHNLSTCYRCGSALEPLPSLQWFVDVNKKIKKYNASLKELMRDSVESKKIRIIPERFEKVYFHWIDSLRDWCISRQIFFGHRLPVYYCDESLGGCRLPHVSLGAPKSCEKCRSTNFVQDPDTLDTWFSSGLWTFSTLGWPDAAKEGFTGIKKTGDLLKFHPTSVMETGYDILFFWVARMILMSRYALGEVPFTTVYLHGLVLDLNRKKMSKSHEETMIDPLDVIPKYGTDALRLSMLVGVTPGNDLLLNEEKIASYRNFVNKLWNIGRFILAATEDVSPRDPRMQKRAATLADRWILSRLSGTVREVTRLIEEFRFSQAAEILRQFTWDDFADWYLEVAKIEGGKSLILNGVLLDVLRLWHPFTPFVTERLYQYYRDQSNSAKLSPLLMTSAWPKPGVVVDADAEKNFTTIKSIVQTIRNARSENSIAAAQYVQVVFATATRGPLLIENEHVIKKLCRIDVMAIVDPKEKPHNALYFKVEDIEIYLPLGMMKIEEERMRLTKEAELFEMRIQDLRARLSHASFTERAPKHIVNREQEKLKEYQAAASKIEEQLNQLKTA